MNPKLIKFIELCLVDGVISDKEREVIFRKSKELGVPEDECEIILEGMIQKLNLSRKEISIDILETSKKQNDQILTDNNINSEGLQEFTGVINSTKKIPNHEIKPSGEGFRDDNSQKKYTKSSDEKDDLNSSKIQHSYIDFTEIQSILNSFEEVVEEINSFVKNEKVHMKEWFKQEFQSFLKEFPFSGDKLLLSGLVNIPKRGDWILGYEMDSSIELNNHSRIADILQKEEFYGFYKKNNHNWQNKERIRKYTQEHINSSKDSLSFLTRDKYEWVNLLWTNKGVHIIRDSKRSKEIFYSYDEIIELDQYVELDQYKIILEKFEDGDERVGKQIMRKIIDSRYFVYLKLPLSDIFSKLQIKLKNDKFITKVSELNPEKEDLDNLLRIDNYIQRSLREYNKILSDINIEYLYDINEVRGNNIFFDLRDRFDILNEIFENHKNFILYITNIYGYRDSFLNNIILKNKVESKRILLQLEDFGVLSTKFERSLTESLDELSNVLKEINNSLLQINDSLVSGLTSITNQLSQGNNILGELNDKMGYSNLVSTIQTYQMYKINQNTKELGE